MGYSLSKIQCLLVKTEVFSDDLFKMPLPTQGCKSDKETGTHISL